MVDAGNKSSASKDVVISADSHVREPHDLWVTRLPSAYRDRVPRSSAKNLHNPFVERREGEGFAIRPGGRDPRERVKEMEVDGVSAEVLFPTLATRFYALEDAGLQEACFRVYNDWLIEYCQAAPKRLVGVPAISVYNIDHAIKELERCLKAGLKGALIWQVANPELPLSSHHYDRFWAAAQDLGVPVSMHTLAGRKPTEDKHLIKGEEFYRRSIRTKLLEAVNALFDFIYYGVLERFPKLRIVIVENEVGWIPFVLQQWDDDYRRYHKDEPLTISMEPSQYFNRQIYATFIKDGVGGHNCQWWSGVENCMWSNDYPHSTSTWPNSRQVIEQDLGHLPSKLRTKLLCTNVAKLYDMEIPQPLQS
jgi:predicted TIM-barrel fold metal-dependent hydrolase